jgi:hypothetical protein
MKYKDNMKKSELRKLIKEEIKNVLSEAKYLGYDKLDEFDLKTNLTIPISAKVKIEKNNYDDGESTYEIKLDYDREITEKAVKKLIADELEKKIRKHYKNEPNLKNVFNKSGSSALIGFAMNYKDSYKF